MSSIKSAIALAGNPERGNALIKVIISVALLVVLIIMIFSPGGPSVDYTVTLPSPPFSKIAASDGYIVYCGKDETVYALDAQTGQLRWSFEGGDAYKTPVIGSGMVLFLTVSKKIYCLDLTTGEKIWVRDVLGWVSKPAIGADLVLFGTGNCLVALDLETGEEVFVFTIDRQHSINELTIVDDMVYFGYDKKSDMYLSFGGVREVDGGLCAVGLEPETPKLYWTAELSNNVVHAPVVKGDLVCVTTDGSAINNAYVLDRWNGEVLWKSVGATSPPVVYDRTVCCASLELKKAKGPASARMMMRTNYFSGFALESGEEIWDSRHGLSSVFPPCRRENLAFFAGKSKIKAIEISSGSGAWSHTTDDEITCPPVIVGNKLILCTANGELQALNLD